MKCIGVIFLPCTHDLAKLLVSEKTIMKLSNLGMSGARLENALVELLQEILLYLARNVFCFNF